MDNLMLELEKLINEIKIRETRAGLQRATPKAMEELYKIREEIEILKAAKSIINKYGQVDLRKELQVIAGNGTLRDSCNVGDNHAIELYTMNKELYKVTYAYGKIESINKI